ncbi:cyclic nucleotide-binding domain-containing protein [Desulfosediminicola sp.]|uniref:cyclic nucleotide-binding domain-containing protein n=1 Tax=Desulfosediminicola sp. TaxID=2886825 RepID=UPI003AF2A711
MTELRKKGSIGLQTPESLVESVRTLAQEGQFARARSVREELMQRFPMELGSIVRSAEIIEEQMSRKLDQDHLTIWATLYNQLTLEEKNCLFHSMRKITVPKGKFLIRQEKPETRLLFIDSGRVTFFHTRGSQRILLGQLSRGDILGDETFFSLSTPTFSVGSQSDVQLYVLNKSDTEGWEDQHPGLYAKIAEYCQKNSRALELLKKNSFEKRSHERQNVEGRVKITLITDELQKGDGYGVGSLVDISLGGVSFDIHSSQPDHARMLLGCELDLAFQGSTGTRAGILHLPGLVVRVSDLHYNDFMLHVRFKSMLSEQDFDKLLIFIEKK